MIDTLGLLTICSTFFIVAASPGPATLATATVSMSAGRAHGLQFGFGLSFGLAFWGVIAATGVGALLQASAYALTVMKLIGGVYLLWLAYGSFRSALNVEPEAASIRIRGDWFKRGLLLNLSNPKAVVAWMATLSLGMTDSGGSMQVFLATGLCIALGFVIYCGYVLAFSTAGAMQVYARARRWIDSVVAGLFAIAGLGLIKSALSR